MHPDFEKNGYMVVRDFFDETTMDILGKYFNMKYKVFLEDEQTRKNTKISVYKKHDKYSDDVAESINYFSDMLAETILLRSGEKLCKILDESLSPTYTFTRIYNTGSKLIPHIDRPSCEISITAPIFISDEKPSKIFISNYTWDKISSSPHEKYEIEEIERFGDYTEVNLFPGDILVYDGTNRYHWRRPLESDYLIQFFLHYVRAHGEYKDFIFDKRPFLGFPDHSRN